MITPGRQLDITNPKRSLCGANRCKRRDVRKLGVVDSEDLRSEQIRNLFFLHYLFMLTLPNMDRCGRAAQVSLSTKNIESSTFNNIATIRNLCMAAFLLNVEL